MTPAYEFLLQNCFWIPVDQGESPEQTALFRGIFEGQPLAQHLSSRFHLSVAQAEWEIQAARDEVQL